MSGGHAASAKSDESHGVQLGKNLIHTWKYAGNVGENLLYNTIDVVSSTWKRVMGLLGDIAIKKPVSATLHLAGGPVAKILDTTATWVSKALGAVKLGHGKQIKPTAWLLRQLNSLVASGVDSIVNVDPTWTNREWHGVRGYIRHAGKKMKENGEQLKARKAAKREARKARRAAVASAVTGKSAGHHADAGEHHDDHEHPAHAHESHAEANHEHKEKKHGHAHADTHWHKAEEHHETSHEPKEEKHHDHAAHNDHNHDEQAHDDSHTAHDDHSGHNDGHTNDDHHASTDEHATHDNHDEHHDDHAKPAHH
jgi:hypothetical protein